MSTPSNQSEFMLLFRGTAWDSGLSPEEIQDVLNRWRAWFRRLTEEGIAKSGHPLADEGKIVSGKKGATIADGPFAESKEAIGGYFFLQVRDLDHALEIARECPALDHGMTVEVRPVVEFCPSNQRVSAKMV